MQINKLLGSCQCLCWKLLPVIISVCLGKFKLGICSLRGWTYKMLKIVDIMSVMVYKIQCWLLYITWHFVSWQRYVLVAEQMWRQQPTLGTTELALVLPNGLWQPFQFSCLNWAEFHWSMFRVLMTSEMPSSSEIVQRLLLALGSQPTRRLSATPSLCGQVFYFTQLLSSERKESHLRKMPP